MVGLPIGVMYGADVLGLALSQMMIAQTSAIGAAATQIVMALTSMAYMPTIGIALAGTTLVGQSIGAGRPRVGESPGQRGHRDVRGADGVHRGAAAGGGAVGVAAVREQRRTRRPTTWWRSGLVLLWPAAAYQIFDGLYCGAGFCLRGAGRHARAGGHRAGAVVVPVRAAGAHADLRAGRRAGSTACHSIGLGARAAGSR